MSSFRDEIDAFILVWNNKYKIDRWWRNKYSIPFGSKSHLEQNVLDMCIEYYEEVLVKDSEEKLAEIELKKISNTYNPGYGKIFKKMVDLPMDQEEIDDAFDKLDISDIKTNEDGSITI